MLYQLLIVFSTTYASFAGARTLFCADVETSSSLNAAYLFAQPAQLECHGQTKDYIVRPSPNKGLGVFALRDLDVGAVILRESPILKIHPPDFVKGTGYPMDAVTRLLCIKFTHLSTQEQEEVRSLAYSGTSAETGSSDPLGLIFKTNAYKSGGEIGLFPRIARINHSCRPNTSYMWKAGSNERIMYANRKISKGEEILDSYISLLLPQEERQRHLRPYGFTCNCEACSAKSSARRESDERRVAIKKTFSVLTPFLTEDYKLADETSMALATQRAKQSAQLVELVHREGLADYHATAYHIAAISHVKAKDWQAATLWANKAYEWRVMQDPQSAYAMEMHELTEYCIENWKADLRRKNMLTKEV